VTYWDVFGMKQTRDSPATTVSKQTRDFYDTVGWTLTDDATVDAQKWEDLRPCAAEYVSACRLRVLRHLPKSGERLLDMASGPIQYPEYLRLSENFAKRVCVDLSDRALTLAQGKLGARGEYLQGDFLEMEIPSDTFDATISLHTIYHMDATQQADAVRKLLKVTKPGAPIVIVYSNPRYPGAPLLQIKRRLSKNKGDIYFHPFPLNWWRQFGDAADVEIHPWRTFEARAQRLLFPNNALGRKMLACLYGLEDRFPALFKSFGCYPMIVLRKRQLPS
jgi:2-polyprenyl-3-methyl-5-hydroxy-6-metoxy-1,4-benzoquinol methylase